MIEELCAERRRVIATLEGLTDEEFDGGATLCAGWAPRDVLGHLIGLDYFLHYYWRVPLGDPRKVVKRIDAGNAEQVERARRLSRRKLMSWAETWAARPSATARLGAGFLLGDLGVHHQDIVRGQGLKREVPDKVADAILREGAFLSPALNRRTRTHRIIPTDGGRPLGRAGAPEVRGTREALGLWLAGRDGVASELVFA